MPINSNRKFIVILAVLAVLALATSLYAWRTAAFPGDLSVSLWLQQFNSSVLRTVTEGLSFWFGDKQAALVVVIGGLLVWWRIGRFEAILIPAAALVSLLNYAFKIAVNRSRPLPDEVRILIVETDKGFPSGHALFSILVLGLIAYFTFIHVRHRSLKILSVVFFTALILVIGASRIYVGDHWLSDIIGGYLIGGVFLTAFIWFYETRKARWE